MDGLYMIQERSVSASGQAVLHGNQHDLERLTDLLLSQADATILQGKELDCNSTCPAVVFYKYPGCEDALCGNEYVVPICYCVSN